MFACSCHWAIQITSMSLSTHNSFKILNIDVESWRTQLISWISMQILKKNLHFFSFKKSWWTSFEWQQKTFEFKSKITESNNFWFVLRMMMRSISIIRLRSVKVEMLNDMMIFDWEFDLQSKSRRTFAIKNKKIIVSCEKQRVICRTCCLKMW